MEPCSRPKSTMCSRWADGGGRQHHPPEHLRHQHAHGHDPPARATHAYTQCASFRATGHRDRSAYRCRYAIDSDSFTIPSGLTFTSASNLVVGQQVSVVVQGSITTASGSGNSTPITGPAAITFTANGITLEPSQITGSVAAVNTPALSFTLSTLPELLRPPCTDGSRAPDPGARQYHSTNDLGDNLHGFHAGQHFGAVCERCGFRGRMGLLNPERQYHYHASGKNGARASWASSTFLTGIDHAHATPKPKGDRIAGPPFLFHRCGCTDLRWSSFW